MAWRLMPFFAVGSLMEIDPNGVSWKYGFAEGAEHYPLTGGKMISFLVLYLTWLWGSYPEANSSSQVRQSVALNHPKNIHFVASSTSTLTSLFGFAFHKKGQNFHPIDFGDSSLFTQSRRWRRWEIYSHTRSPNISAASVGCGKNMKHYTLLFFSAVQPNHHAIFGVLDAAITFVRQ